jgi:hypothetical protein
MSNSFMSQYQQSPSLRDWEREIGRREQEVDARKQIIVSMRGKNYRIRSLETLNANTAANHYVAYNANGMAAYPVSVGSHEVTLVLEEVSPHYDEVDCTRIYTQHDLDSIIAEAEKAAYLQGYADRDAED